MDYIGTWKLHSVMVFDDNDLPVYLAPEAYLHSPMPYIDESDEEAVADEMKERQKTIGMKIKICEDGNLYLLMPLPAGVSQAEIDRAVAAGVIKVMDGAMTDDPMRWELRDSVFWLNTGMAGEIM